MPSSSSTSGGPFGGSKMGVNTRQNPPQTKMPKKKFMPKVQTERPTYKTSKKKMQKQQQKRWK